MSLELRKIQEEVAKTFEALKEANDQAIADADERHGQAAADLTDKVERINEALTELRERQEKLRGIPCCPETEQGHQGADPVFRGAARDR